MNVLLGVGTGSLSATAASAFVKAARVLATLLGARVGGDVRGVHHSSTAESRARSRHWYHHLGRFVKVH
jgi:hypothetical protein